MNPGYLGRSELPEGKTKPIPDVVPELDLPRPNQRSNVGRASAVGGALEKYSRVHFGFTHGRMIPLDSPQV